MPPSVALNESLPVALGDAVTFSTDGIPPNVQNPRIEVLAYQAACHPDYTCLDGPDGTVLTFGMAGAIDYEFLLGGGGSAWLAQGGPAHVVINLYHFDKVKGKNVAVYLATTEFDAGG